MMFPLIHGIIAYARDNFSALDRYGQEVMRQKPWVFWRMDEQGPPAGAQLIDESGNERHGTYVYVPHSANPTPTASYTSSPGEVIPDESPVGVTSAIAVAESFTIAGLRVHLDIPHSFVYDLVITLRKVGGPSATIWEDEETYSDYGMNLWVISPSISSGGGVYSANLSAFEGLSSTGAWELHVEDIYSGAIGTLKSWTLELYNASSMPSSASHSPPMASAQLIRGPADPEVAHVDTPYEGVFVAGNSTVTLNMDVAEKFSVAAINIEILYAAGGDPDVRFVLSKDGVSVVIHEFGSTTGFADPFKIFSSYSHSSVSESRGPGNATQAMLLLDLNEFAGTFSDGVWELEVTCGAGGGIQVVCLLDLYSSIQSAGTSSTWFDGVNALPASSEAMPILGADSLPVKEVEAWIEFGDLYSDQIIFREGNNNRGWALGINNENLSVGIVVNGVGVRADYPVSNLNTDDVFYVCAVVNRVSNQLKIFINAVEVAQTGPTLLGAHAGSGIGAVIGSGCNAFIGGYFNPLNGSEDANNFIGKIDETAIYDRERTTAERLALYQLGRFFDFYDAVLFYSFPEFSDGINHGIGGSSLAYDLLTPDIRPAKDAHDSTSGNPDVLFGAASGGSTIPVTELFGDGLHYTLFLHLRPWDDYGNEDVESDFIEFGYGSDYCLKVRMGLIAGGPSFTRNLIIEHRTVSGAVESIEIEFDRNQWLRFAFLRNGGSAIARLQLDSDEIEDAEDFDFPLSMPGNEIFGFAGAQPLLVTLGAQSVNIATAVLFDMAIPKSRVDAMLDKMPAPLTENPS